MLISIITGRYFLSLTKVVIAKYMEAVKKIGFEDQPDYDLLRKILKEDLIKHKEENKAFDWEKRLAPSTEKREPKRRTKY